jgi:hypothetical protein
MYGSTDKELTALDRIVKFWEKKLEYELFF